MGKSTFSAIKGRGDGATLFAGFIRFSVPLFIHALADARILGKKLTRCDLVF